VRSVAYPRSLMAAATAARKTSSIIASPTSAEADRLRNPRRYLQRQAEGAEQRHHADRPVPGAQLGQEPQVLQLVKSGDVEFCISSSANAATLSPQAGVMSMHFLFRSEAHLVKAMADPEVSKAVKAMIAAPCRALA